MPRNPQLLLEGMSWSVSKLVVSVTGVHGVSDCVVSVSE